LNGREIKWLLLAYKIPREPTSTRVYVWRKLKRLDALAIQDAVWVLPATPATREQFRWLAAEIEELHGSATLWEARQVLDGMDETLVKHFVGRPEAEYRKILSDLKRASDLEGLVKRFRRAQSTDYLRSDLAERVREALIENRTGPPKGRSKRRS
jgi:ChrB-like protein